MYAHFTKAEIFLKQGDQESACKEYNKSKELGIDLDKEDEAEFIDVCN